MAKTSRKSRAKTKTTSKTTKPKAAAVPLAASAPDIEPVPAATAKSAAVKTASRSAYKPLPNVWQLTKGTLGVLWSHKKLWGGLLLIYGLLNLILVNDFTAVANVNALKNQLYVQYGNTSSLNAGLNIFTKLMGTGGTSSTGDGAYQFVFLIIISLASIWALRQFGQGVRVRLRDMFYRGMYPLIPFMLILLLIGLQLLPLVVGATLYGMVSDNGIAVGPVQHLFFLALMIALAIVTLYLTASSLMALYIVCQPDMTPMSALRTARGLVRRRRWLMIRKILFLPLVMLVIAAAIMIPLIILWASAAPWVFLLLALCALPAAHAYLYGLYRAAVETADGVPV